MNELIKISEHNGKRAVNARELHFFLESKREFATWIKDRITRYGFVENQDYVVFDEFVKNPSGGRPQKEYALSINCAKEISMVEGNAKGKQARQYFIEQEEKAQKMQLEAKADTVLLFIESISKTLNMNENSKLLMYRNAADRYGVDLKILPEYTNSVDTLLPLSKIFDGTLISAMKGNASLEAQGVIEKKHRIGSKGIKKSYWSIAREYSHLGENQVSPNNPRETQPMWYDSRRDEVIGLITNRKSLIFKAG
jgi:phage anti-repressor protein